MVWELEKKLRYSTLKRDKDNHRLKHSTFFIGPRHVKHRSTKEFIEFSYTTAPNFASESNCRVFAQNSHVAIEVYDFYVKMFNPDYETVSVHDARFDIQYLFKSTPFEQWRSVDYYNPSIQVIPLEDGVEIKKTFDTDYGTASLEISYIIRTGAFLKHTIVFHNKMVDTKTFRAVMKLAGITNDKVKHKGGSETIIGEKHIISPFLSIGEDNQHLKLTEYLWSLGISNKETGEWTATTLRDIIFNTHSQGCKVDIVIGNYTLAKDESLLIDPDSDTFQVGASADDACERGDGDFTTNTDIICINSDEVPTSLIYHCGGFRFQNVNIPKSSPITLASVTFWCPGVEGDNNLNTDIYGNDVDNAQNFVDNANIISEANRPRTSASVSWVEFELGLGWHEKTALEDIIQEIVDRDGWIIGNAMVILLIAKTDQIKLCSFNSYDNLAFYGGKLDVTWTAMDLIYQKISQVFSSKMFIKCILSTLYSVLLSVYKPIKILFANTIFVKRILTTSFSIIQRIYRKILLSHKLIKRVYKIFPYNLGLLFNGTTAYVDCGDITAIEELERMSVEAWVKWESEENTFGNETIGASAGDIKDYIKGTKATCPESGTAQNIIVHFPYTWDAGEKIKCALFKESDYSLVGVTEERDDGGSAGWYTFSFADPKPSLSNIDYNIVVWSDSFVYISQTSSVIQNARFQSLSYNSFPNPWIPSKSYTKYSIYCTYTSTATERVIVRKNSVFKLVMGTTPHKAEFLVQIAGEWKSSGVNSTNIDDGNWHHLVGTYDNDQLRLYVDKECLEGVACSGLTESDAYSVGIGAYTDGTWKGFWNGKIDQVRLYSRALSQSEVNNNYTGTAVSTNVVARYEMNRGSGDTIYDISGSDNDGTITNATWTTCNQHRFYHVLSLRRTQLSFINMVLFSIREILELGYSSIERIYRKIKIVSTLFRRIYRILRIYNHVLTLRIQSLAFKFSSIEFIKKINVLVSTIREYIPSVLSIGYTIKEFVIKELSLIYKILENIYRTIDLKYLLKNSIRRIIKIPFGLRENVYSRLLSIVYSSVGRLFKKLLMAYSTSPRVVRMLALTNDLIERIYSRISIVNHVMNLVRKSIGILYSLLSLRTKELALSFSITAIIKRIIALPFTIYSYRRRIIALRYSLIGYIKVLLSMGFRLGLIVERILTLRLSLLSYIRKSLRLEYRLGLIIEATLGILYSSIAYIKTSLSVRFSVIGVIKRIFKIKYLSKVLIRREVSLKYSLISRIHRILEMKWISGYITIERVLTFSHSLLEIFIVLRYRLKRIMPRYIVKEFSKSLIVKLDKLKYVIKKYIKRLVK